MIVAQIVGGLGNQLFQVATGTALAARLGVELQLDCRYFKKNLPVQDDLYLHHFGHGAREARPNTLPASPQDGICAYLGGRISGAFGAARMHQFREAGLAYDRAFRSLGDDTYLAGYWQSARYFHDYADQVRARLHIITPPSDENAAILREIKDIAAVSLHIRRGDYVTSAKFNAMYGTCDLGYYQRAAALIAARLDRDPVFYAFSDDPDWVRENLHLPHEIRVIGQNDAATSYEDIRLMSACKHHIVANSSFSWWGAWLNPSPNKVVIAPKRWFADPAMQDHDILPEDWITL